MPQLTQLSPSSSPVSVLPATDMVWIDGRTFCMGSNHHYPEEAPARSVVVDAFWIDRSPVTNDQFQAFAEATGHKTWAEIPPDPLQYPGARPELLQPGSLVFVKPPGPVDTRDCHNWWQFVIGADWRHPQGPESSIDDRGNHPVVHVAYSDAEAYAAWAGKSLPTEAEWECAARGGLEGAEFAWGTALTPGGRAMANYWQGTFPWENTVSDGYEGTSPIGAFPPNGYGLVDMIGNTWEWTCDWYRAGHTKKSEHACCIPKNPRGGTLEESYDPGEPQIRIPRKVIKGGSHLCAPNYCRRYRPAARFPEPIDTSTCHLGFRCVMRPPM